MAFSSINPVTRLHNVCDQRKLPHPNFHITSRFHSSNKHYFEVCAKVGSIEATGGGKTVKEARKNAAYFMTLKFAALGKGLDDELQKPEEYSSPFDNDYIFHQQIGGGGFGIVVQATSKSTKIPLAIKRVQLPLKDKDREKIIKGDVECLARLNHPHIVRFYKHWFEDPPMGWQEKFDDRVGIKNDSQELGCIEEFSDLEGEVSDSLSSATSSIQLSSSYLYIEMELCLRGTLEKWLSEGKERTMRPMNFFY